MRFTVVKTAWGGFGFVSEQGLLLATFLPQSPDQVRRRMEQDWPGAAEDMTALPRFRRAVTDYFAGMRTSFSSVKIDLSRTPPFHRLVLEACRQVPYGRTASYVDLARAVDNPAAARAVGQAMARNPFPLVVPCHRVLRADGTFGGFSSPNGVREKERLLFLENALPGAVHLTRRRRKTAAA